MANPLDPNSMFTGSVGPDLQGTILGQARQPNILQRMGRGIGQVDPMMLMAIGANLLAAGGPSPVPISGGARFGQAMQGALGDIGQIQSLKQRQGLLDLKKREQEMTLKRMQATQAMGLKGYQTLKNLASDPMSPGGATHTPEETAALEQFLTMAQTGATPADLNAAYKNVLGVLKPDQRITRQFSLPNNMVQDQELDVATGQWVDVGDAYDRRRKGALVEFNTGENVRPTKTSLSMHQKEISRIAGALEQLNQVGGQYDGGRYMGYFPRIKAWVGELGNQFNMDTAWGDFAADRSGFALSLRQFFNDYRRWVTGAAAAFVELEDLLNSVVNPDQSRASFEKNWEALVNGLVAGLEMHNRYVREGYDVTSPVDRPTLGDTSTPTTERELLQSGIQATISKMGL